MNKYKDRSAEEKIQKKRYKATKPNKIVRSVLNVFSGNFLSKDTVINHLPFLLFITLIGLAYIANGYYAEKSVREISRITNNLKELKSEYITSKSELMFMSNQSEVARSSKHLGLKESLNPPKKIVVQVEPQSNQNN